MASITEGDRGVIRNHLGALLPLPLSKVTTKVIDQHYTRLTKNERSPQVVFRVHRILGAAFRQGEKWGDIKHSPVRNVTAPRVPVVEVEATPIDVLHTLIDLLVAEGQLDAAAFCWIAILTGMRRGEILRLQWRDLDRERGAVS